MMRGMNIKVAMAALLLAAGPVLADPTNPSLDEMLSIPSGPATRPAPGATQPANAGRAPKGDHPAPAGSNVPIDPGVSRRLSGVQPDDLLKQALLEMIEASERLGKARDTDIETQRIQETILAKLDRVIAAAQQNQQQQQSSGSGKPDQQAQQSRQEHGSEKNASQEPGQEKSDQQSQKGEGDQNQQAEGARGENRGQSTNLPGGKGVTPGTLEQGRTEWGNLPARLRDELQEGLSAERVSPIYRELIWKYYQRLAEEGK